MSIIIIDSAALATVVQDLTAERPAGLGTIYLNGRESGIDALQRQLLQYARSSLMEHDDVVGPVAWRHLLPNGQTFLGGRNSQVAESLQEALGHLDRFGGHLEPLFKLVSAGNSDTWKNEGSRAAPTQAITLGRRQLEAFDLSTGRPVIQNVGAAIDAAAAEAAGAGEPDANKPANEGGGT